MKTLPIDIDTFGFVQRESYKGKTVRNKCGRDFLYYTLHYFFPHTFNAHVNNPEQIDDKNLFGMSFKGFNSVLFAWSQLQFYKMPKLLNSLGLSLKINDIKVSSFWKMIRVLLCSKKDVQDAIPTMQKAVDEGKVVGVDIALKYEGLLDHVMFVYGYDEENLYVFDTHQIPSIEYVKLTDDTRFYMKLPKSIVQKRWKRWSRVWVVERIK